MPYPRIYYTYRYIDDTFSDTFFANLYYLKSYKLETSYVNHQILT